jgi:hypothetical protein
MAVQKGKNGEWMSTLTGNRYTSEQAAAHYDKREQMRRGTPETEEDKKLASMKPAEIRKLIEAMDREVAANTNGGSVTEVHEWIANNPHISRDGTAQGYDNMVAINKFLTARGKVYPFSTADLDWAANNLVDEGKIHVDHKLEAELVEEQLKHDDLQRFRISR